MTSSNRLAVYREMRIVCVILMPLLLFGCGGFPVSPKRAYDKCPFEGGEITQMVVSANQPWKDTGIVVDTGDKLFFDAQGTWAFGLGYSCSAAGRTGGVYFSIMPDLAAGALIGRIGEATPFLVGTQRYKIVETPGVLFLCINEKPSVYFDNSGCIDVTISHRKVGLSANSPKTATQPPVPPPPGVSLRSASKTRIVAAGISTYSDSGISKVDYAASDAQAFAAFAQQAGVPVENITTLVGGDATRSKIIEAVDKLRMATMDKSETAMFYFSGHGAPLVKDGRIYSSVVVPYDASEQNLGATGIDLDWLRERLGDLPGNSIVILDACFTGKEGRSIMAKNLRGLAIVPKSTDIVPPPGANTWWLTATSGDNFANDLPRESHGLFTYYLLKALSGEQGVDTDQDGLITIKEAFTWTKEKVQSVSAKSLGRLQVPELMGSGDTALTMPR